MTGARAAGGDSMKWVRCANCFRCSRRRLSPLRSRPVIHHRRPTSRPIGTRSPSPQQAAIANMQMALEYMRISNLAQARDRIERALGEAPENADVQETAGLVYERLNEIAKAKHAFSAAARLGKNDPDILNSYAGFLCRTGKTADGREAVHRGRQESGVQDPRSGVAQRRGLRAAPRVMWSTPSAISTARSPSSRTCRRRCCNSAISRTAAATTSRLSMTCSAISRSIRLPPRCCGWAFARSASWATTRDAAVFGRRMQTEFPDSEQAQMLRAGIDR